MLVAYLIMLREGIEAALIVGIVASYLKQTGRSRFMPAVWLGVVLALVICVALGFALTAHRGRVSAKAAGSLRGLRGARRGGRADLHGLLDEEGRQIDQDRAPRLGRCGARPGQERRSRARRHGVLRGRARRARIRLLSARHLPAGCRHGAARRCPARRPLGRGLRCRHHLWRGPARSQALLPLDQRAHRLRGGGVAGRRAAGVPRGGSLERAAGPGLRSQRRAAGRQRPRRAADRDVRLPGCADRRRGRGLSGVPRSRPSGSFSPRAAPPSRRHARPRNSNTEPGPHS